MPIVYPLHYTPVAADKDHFDALQSAFDAQKGKANFKSLEFWFDFDTQTDPKLFSLKIPNPELRDFRRSAVRTVISRLVQRLGCRVAKNKVPPIAQIDEPKVRYLSRLQAGILDRHFPRTLAGMKAAEDCFYKYASGALQYEIYYQNMTAADPSSGLHYLFAEFALAAMDVFAAGSPEHKFWTQMLPVFTAAEALFNDAYAPQGKKIKIRDVVGRRQKLNAAARKTIVDTVKSRFSSASSTAGGSPTEAVKDEHVALAQAVFTSAGTNPALQTGATPST